jgi:general secretion pathway protein D
LTTDPRIAGNLSGKSPSQQASLDRLQARRFGFWFLLRRAVRHSKPNFICMTSRLVRICVAFVSSALVFDAFAQNPPAPAPGAAAQPPATATPQPSVPVAGDPNESVMLKLPDADIDTVISALEIYTGRTVIRPQQLQTATYNLKFARPMPKWKAIVAIETALALNNIGIAPLGDDIIKMVNLQFIKGEAPEMITGSAFDLPPTGKAATKLFQLEFARVQEVQPMLTGMLNPFYGQPVPLVNANALLITDSVSNLQRVEMLLQQVDRPVAAGMKPKFYQLKNGAKASDLVTKLRSILQGTLMTQLGAATSYSADDRTNQIIVVTDPRQHAFFDELIDRLDQRSDPNTRNDVIFLKHANAADLVAVLGRIISGQTAATSATQRQGGGSLRPGQGMGPTQPQQPQLPGTPPQPAQPVPAQVVSASNTANALDGQSNEFSPFMTVASDERSNSVVVSGTTDDIRLLKELIAKLDTVLAQVRIEVVIAEVTLTDNHQSGISQLGLKVDGDKLVGFFGNSPSVSVQGPDGTGNTFATITRPGTSGAWDLAGTISIGTTPRKENTTILSVPTITTSHAKKANVFVGETRPIISGTVNSGQTGGTTSTTVQQDIGINLTVTPLIGIDGSVQLEIEQDVDEVGPVSVEIDGNQQPIILKRNTSSFVSVKSGEIIVLGGLQRTSNTRSSNRLGPIPIIGDILGSRQRSQTRTELLFFLRPHMLTNTPADNAPAFKRIDELPQRDAIHQQLDPNYVPPPKSILDKILPK